MRQILIVVPYVSDHEEQRRTFINRQPSCHVFRKALSQATDSSGSVPATPLPGEGSMSRCGVDPRGEQHAPACGHRMKARTLRTLLLKKGLGALVGTSLAGVAFSLDAT